MSEITTGFSYAFKISGLLSQYNPNLPPQPTFAEVLSAVQTFAEANGWSVEKAD
jgi:hypothetical protein